MHRDKWFCLSKLTKSFANLFTTLLVSIHSARMHLSLVLVKMTAFQGALCTVVLFCKTKNLTSILTKIKDSVGKFVSSSNYYFFE